MSIKDSVKADPKDIFLHLLAIILLYMAAAGFVNLIFQYINIFLPDPLELNPYSLSSAYGSIRFSIASLIVVFPLYIWTSWFLNGQYIAEPEKRGLRIRKWLVYFTLFATALIIAGDIVALINNFLGGELTTRFILKVATILLVASSIFGFYFWDLKKNKVK